MVSIWFWIRFAGMVFLWLGKWFMIFLWFQYGFEYGRENDLWFSYGFEYDFFMVLNMIFYGFEYDFLWFWIWFFYGFGRNLLQNQFLWWNQNRKKIVNATKVPRNCFLAKNSRNFRFFTILVRFPFPRSFFPPQKLILKQIPTKIVKKS